MPTVRPYQRQGVVALAFAKWLPALPARPHVVEVASLVWGRESCVGTAVVLQTAVVPHKGWSSSDTWAG